MRHLARPFAVLFAVWFAIVLGDPGVLHTCAMHGGHGGHGATPVPAAATTHDAHAAHGTHGAAHQSVPADARSPMRRRPAPASATAAR